MPKPQYFPGTGANRRPRGRVTRDGSALGQDEREEDAQEAPKPAPTTPLTGIGGGGGQAKPPAAPKPKPANKYDTDTLKQGEGSKSDTEKLADARAAHAAERAAVQDEQKARRQRALANVSARAGLGGLGLSGATAASMGDVDRQMSRTDTMELADLDEKHRDEEWERVQQEIALFDFEVADDRDIDGDGRVGGKPVGGLIGDGDPENNPGDTPEEQDDIERAKVGEILSTMQGDGGDLSPYTGTVDDAEDLRAAGIEFEMGDARAEESGGRFWVVVRGDDGRLYKFDVGEEVLTAAGWGGGGDSYAVGEAALEALGLG